MDHPDPKKHLYISLVKSIVRIGGAGAAIYTGSIVILAASLLAAEVIGIAEELV